MKMKMHENSLFAVLMRQPWWVSALVAAGIVAVLRLFMPILYAVFASMPFLVMTVYVGWKQLRRPSDESISKKLDALRALSWDEFAAALQAGYEREGWEVKRIGGGQADLQLVRRGERVLMSCKRWKATRTGIEPLRELDAARRLGEAQIGVYVAAGEITQQARAYAAETGIQLVEARELVRVMRG